MNAAGLPVRFSTSRSYLVSMDPTIPVGRNAVGTNLNTTIEAGIHPHFKFQNKITIVLIGGHKRIGGAQLGNPNHFTVLHLIDSFSVELGESVKILPVK